MASHHTWKGVVRCCFRGRDGRVTPGALPWPNSEILISSAALMLWPGEEAVLIEWTID